MEKVRKFLHFFSVCSLNQDSTSASSGQVLLLVVVTMIVALTVGLSIASRTVTNLKLSKQNQDSQRAFQAATAGIEKYINQANRTGPTDTLLNASAFTTDVGQLSGSQILLNNGDVVDQDRGIDSWLSTYPTYADKYSGTITLYWGVDGVPLDCSSASPNKKKAPALEVVILTGSITNPTFTKRVFDPCNNTSVAGSVNRANNFEIPASTP